MNYKVTYESGGGTTREDGVWLLKKKPKTMLVEKLEGAYFTLFKVGTKKKIGPKTGSPMIDHKDGTFTVYFDQAGTPYYFEPLASSN